MTLTEAREHLELRVRDLDSRYVRDYPRWTLADYVAVSLLLRQASEEGA